MYTCMLIIYNKGQEHIRRAGENTGKCNFILMKDQFSFIQCYYKTSCLLELYSLFWGTECFTDLDGWHASPQFPTFIHYVCFVVAGHSSSGDEIEEERQRQRASVKRDDLMKKQPAFSTSSPPLRPHYLFLWVHFMFYIAFNSISEKREAAQSLLQRHTVHFYVDNIV